MLALLLVVTAVLAPCLVSAEGGEGGVLIQDSSIIRIEGLGGGGSLAPDFGSPGPGDILFEQPPHDPWKSAWYSDTESETLCMDDFWGLTGDIGDIHWYGISASCDPGCHDCDPTSIEFEIIFYQDAAGSPGAPVATFSNVTPAVTYLYTDSYSVYRFDVDSLGTPVGLNQGWVSIQSTSGCRFWWLNSPSGNSKFIQELRGVPDNYTTDLAFALTEAPTPPPVGGEAYPVSKASLLAPWIAVGLVLAGGISWYILRRRWAQS